MIYATITETNEDGVEGEEKIFSDPEAAQEFVKEVNENGGTVDVEFGPVEDTNTAL